MSLSKDDKIWEILGVMFLGEEHDDIMDRTKWMIIIICLN